MGHTRATHHAITRSATEARISHDHKQRQDRRRSAETGVAQWQVWVELRTHRDTVVLAKWLSADGKSIVRRWKSLVAAAPCEDDAHHLAATIQRYSAADATVHVKRACRGVLARAGCCGLPGVKLMLGPDVGFGKQVVDGYGPEAIIGSDDDLDGWEIVEQNLAAPAARGNNPPVAIAHGDDRVQLVGALGGSRADDNQLSAWTSGEVICIHRCDDPAVASAGSSRHGVLAASAASARDLGRSLDEFVVNMVGLRGHLLCLHGVQATLARVTMMRNGISAACCIDRPKETARLAHMARAD